MGGGGVGGQGHDPAALPPGKDPVPIVWEAGWVPGRSGRVRKISSPTGIRSPDRPARSQSLYRLSYPGHLCLKGVFVKCTIYGPPGNKLFLKLN